VVLLLGFLADTHSTTSAVGPHPRIAALSARYSGCYQWNGQLVDASSFDFIVCGKRLFLPVATLPLPFWANASNWSSEALLAASAPNVVTAINGDNLGLAAFDAVELIPCQDGGTMLDCVAINTSDVSESIPSAPLFNITRNDSWYKNRPLAYGYIYTCDFRPGKLGYISMNLTGTPFTINDAFSIHFGCFGGDITFSSCRSSGEIQGTWDIPVACATFVAQVGGLCCDTASSALAPRAPCTRIPNIHTACIPIRLAQRFAVLPTLWSSSPSATPSFSGTTTQTTSRTPTMSSTRTFTPSQSLTQTLSPQAAPPSSASISPSTAALRDANIAALSLLCLAFLAYALARLARAQGVHITSSAAKFPEFAASPNQDLRAPLN
jgi:hypothetical protein